jgi:hypothetical protein
MVRVARHKAERAGVADRIRFRRVPMEELGACLAGEVFDGVYSNFGAVNCARSLESLSADIAPCLAAGAPLVWVVMGRFVPWEWAWYLAQGNTRRAFRRLNRRGVEWRGITVTYPTPAALGRELRAHFTPLGSRALGFALPPSYAGAWLEDSPRSLAALARIERVAQWLPGCASLADHYIFEARRNLNGSSHAAR